MVSDLAFAYVAAGKGAANFAGKVLHIITKRNPKALLVK